MNDIVQIVGFFAIGAVAVWVFLLVPLWVFGRIGAIQGQLSEYRRTQHAQTKLLTELSQGLTDLSDDVQAMLGSEQDDEVEPIR